MLSRFERKMGEVSKKRKRSQSNIMGRDEKVLKLVDRYEFRRVKNLGQWHIVPKNSHPGELPLCAKSGTYSFKAKHIKLKKELCAGCLKEAQKNGILLGFQPRKKKK